MDTSDSSITFDDRGWCVYCNNFYNSILPSWHTDATGEKKLLETAEKIKEQGKGKDFDCIIGLSGGLFKPWRNLRLTSLRLKSTPISEIYGPQG